MMETEDVRLIQGDCLELMKDIPDKSVDMILCDLPYGTTACKWDTIIPFDKLWEQYKRIVKDNCAIAMFCNMPFTAKIVGSNYQGYKHHWIWIKNRGTGFQVAKYRPMMQHEDIIVFTKNGERINYYPIKVKLDKPKKYNYAKSSNGTNPLAHFGKGYYYAYDKYPTNILFFDKISKPLHPTQKPVALLEYLIRTYTNENDLVLDNTMGSGSTGVAAVNTGRKFIGFELNKEYFNIAEKRVNDVITEKQSKLF